VRQPTALDVERRRSFGLRVRELRKTKQLSQMELAHQCGLDRTYVGSVERGERNISLDNIWLLADTLGVSPSELIVHRGG
jgi:transcriptional regulator with XRE-family HTH domain